MKLPGVFLTVVFLLSFASDCLARAYPDEIEKLVKKATTKIVCEKNNPRRVGTIIYKKDDAKWLIRIFTKDGEELEIWFSKKIVFKWQAFFPNKIFYNASDKGWIDKASISTEEAAKLDERLKFDSEEMEFFKTCAEESERKKNK